MRSTFQPGVFRYLFSSTFQLFLRELLVPYCLLTAPFSNITSLFKYLSTTRNFKRCPDSSCPIAIRIITSNRDHGHIVSDPGLTCKILHYTLTLEDLFDRSTFRMAVKGPQRAPRNIFSNNTSFVT
jgi:hypothetical protein